MTTDAAIDILTANGFASFEVYATGPDFIDAVISFEALDAWSRRTYYMLSIPEDGDGFPEPTVDGGIVFKVHC